MHSVNNKSLYVQGALNPLDHKDLLQCIARHLLPSNAFTDALPIQLKAVIFVSKSWNQFLSPVIDRWKAFHIQLQKEALHIHKNKMYKSAQNAIAEIIEKKLQVASLRKCHDLTFELLQKLMDEAPQVEHLFIQSDKITSLPLSCQRLKTLYCNGSSNLKELPFMPRLTKIICSSCIRLKILPLMPSLTGLECYYCTGLSEPPPFPSLKRLNCSGCSTLKSFGDLPLLEELDAYYCNSLKTLPLTPMLISLDFSYCASILGCDKLIGQAIH